MEPLLNPEVVKVPPNHRTVVFIKSQKNSENTISGFSQPSDLLYEEGDMTFCAEIVILARKDNVSNYYLFHRQTIQTQEGAAYC